MTDNEPYLDPIEEAEKTAKDPEKSPQAPDDWPRTMPDRAPAEPAPDA
jgi:hypothetical protein